MWEAEDMGDAYDPDPDGTKYKEKKIAKTVQASDEADEAYSAAIQAKTSAGYSASQDNANRSYVIESIDSLNTKTKKAAQLLKDSTECSGGYPQEHLSADDFGDGEDAGEVASTANNATNGATHVTQFSETMGITTGKCGEELKELNEEIIALSNAIAEVATELAASLEAEKAVQDALIDKEEATLEEMKADPDQYSADQIKGQQAIVDALKEKQRTGGPTLGDIAATTPPFFNEQCFLLAQAPVLVRYKAATLDYEQNGKRLPYRTTTAKTGTTTAWNNSSGYNASLLAQGDPFAFVNHLTQYPGYQHLLTMKTSAIANLQPMIRLFKIITKRDEDGNPVTPEEAFEIPFDSYFTKKDMEWYKSKDKRGVGVGIKDFTFSYEADNPFAVKKSIKAKLTLFANSFDELLVPRGSGQNEFKYVDLALKTGRARSFSLASLNPKEPDVVQENLAKLDFRLKAVVGWAPIKSNLTTLSSNEKSAIYNSCVSLNLTPTVHTFDIDDQGRVKFIINYLAYVEDFFDQPNFNIFTSTEVEKNRINRKIKFQTWIAKCDSEQFSELKKAEQPEIEEDKIKSFQSLIGDLFEAEKIRYIELESADVLNFRQEGPFFDASQIIGGGGISNLTGTESISLSSEIQSAINAGGGTDAEKRVKMLSLAGTGAENKTQTLTFFYVSDLMDIILEGIDKKYGDDTDSISKYLETMAKSPGSYLISPEGKKITGKEVNEQIQQQIKIANVMGAQFKRFRLLLGPLEIVDQAALVQSTFPSLGDLPISVKYFIEWLSRKMAKRDEVYYPLPKFLNDFFNDLIREFLNSSQCFHNQAKQKTRVSQAVITSYKDTRQGPDEITQLILNARKNSSTTNIARLDLADHIDVRPLLANNSGDENSPIVEKPIGYEINYLTFFAGRTQPTEKMKGNETSDHGRGIFHYSIGRDRGITKTIKLTKTDSAGLKELRFEQDGYDGLKQLREVFDVDIETYANVNAYPGNYIFVDPTGFSPQTTFGGDAIDLTQIGIGGYHMIIRSEHSFGAGRANSRIYAKWVASTDARATTNPQGEDMTTAPQTNAIYCWTDKSDRKNEAETNSSLKKFSAGGS